jgi:hypothetical protein
MERGEFILYIIGPSGLSTCRRSIQTQFNWEGRHEAAISHRPPRFGIACHRGLTGQLSATLASLYSTSVFERATSAIGSLDSVTCGWQKQHFERRLYCWAILCNTLTHRSPEIVFATTKKDSTNRIRHCLETSKWLQQSPLLLGLSLN